MKYPIGIVVVAVNIEDKIRTRFRDILYSSSSLYMDWICTVRYWEEYSMNIDGLLNKSEALNDGITRLRDECEIIICTDIDMLIPPQLIEYTYEMLKVPNNTNLWIPARNIDEDKITPIEWDKWKKLPLRMSGTGSFNAMRTEDWIESGGWDERFIGWGGEDDFFKLQREHFGIKTIVSTDFPLMHVNHLPRQNKQALNGINKNVLEIRLKEGFKKWL